MERLRTVIYTVIITLLVVVGGTAAADTAALKEFRGVVTYHLLPAKLMRISEIIENPEPGTSYIGKDSILVQLRENPDVMANWSIVNVKYYEYEQPKVVKFEIMSEPGRITVKNRAVQVDVEGDLSRYISQPE